MRAQVTTGSLPLIYSLSLNSFLVHEISLNLNKSNTMDATNETGTFNKFETFAFGFRIHGENKLIFIEMMMRSTLWIFIVKDH
jgi:hypothetical protein